MSKLFLIALLALIGYSGYSQAVIIEQLNPAVRLIDTDGLAGDTYQIINNTLGKDVLNFAIYNKTDERAELSFDGTGDVSLLNGALGVGTEDPRSKLQVSNGDIYLDDINSGVIMKSPDGNCWRMTITNAGTIDVQSTLCP